MDQAAIPGTTAAIILAAGRSSRMRAGYHKLLLPLAGQPVLAHVLASVKASQARPIILVLGYQAEEIQQQLAPELASLPDLQIIHNPAYQEGMSSSLRAGIQALTILVAQKNKISKKMRPILGSVIILGDQPLLTSEIIDRVIQAQHEQQAAIVTPLYHGKRGQPTLFATHLFPELLQVTGDEGGKSVIANHKNELATVELGDAMVNYDVDTWEAYQELLAHWEQTHQTQK
ncbi:MAG TPA: nucleotidyltransferase family protein [Ktedonobacteraceae bacterium]|nr:nucleotidyltransferase family protein [Ktedonobacteraceae bacterium]